MGQDRKEEDENNGAADGSSKSFPQNGDGM
jgi:hypothetical protein